MKANPTPETEDWFTEKCRDPEFVKAYLEEQRKIQRKVYANDLRDAIAEVKERFARVAESHRCRDLCEHDHIEIVGPGRIGEYTKEPCSVHIAAALRSADADVGKVS